MLKILLNIKFCLSLKISIKEKLSKNLLNSEISNLQSKILKFLKILAFQPLILG